MFYLERFEVAGSAGVRVVVSKSGLDSIGGEQANRRDWSDQSTRRQVSFHLRHHIWKLLPRLDLSGVLHLQVDVVPGVLLLQPGRVGHIELHPETFQ